MSRTPDSAKTGRQPVEFFNPVKIVIENDGIGAVLVICPDLFGQQAASFVAALHLEQDTPALVYAVQPKHRHQPSVAWFVRVAPGGGKRELHGVGEIDLKGAQFLGLTVTVYGDLPNALGLVGDVGNVLMGVDGLTPGK